MELLVISSSVDFVAIVEKGCRICAEKKLNATIISSFPMTMEELKIFKKEMELPAYRIICEPINHK